LLVELGIVLFLLFNFLLPRSVEWVTQEHVHFEVVSLLCL
jgi:hypothetical protein